MQDLDRYSALRIARPGDVRPAALALKTLVETLGDWRVAVTHNIATRRPMCDAEGDVLAESVFGWTDHKTDCWWRMPRLAFTSPIPVACRFESEPFWCNSQGFRTSTPNPFVQRIDVSEFVRRSHSHAAIVVPVHMPFGVIGAATVVPRDLDHTDLAEDFAQHGDMLGVAIRSFVATYTKVMTTQVQMPLGNDLSSREVECLKWAAIGKTDLEIGMIMSRSRATIRFHMHNAVEKLECVNRSQAVFKATQLGYLTFNA